MPNKIEKGDLHQKTFTIQWKIERFIADCKEDGDSYTSPLFPIQYANKATNWYLTIYPKGNSGTNKDFVSLFLYFECDEISEVTVDHQSTIVSGKNRISAVRKADIFTSPAKNWGWSKFVKTEVITDTKSGALIDDTLTISCKITFVPKTTYFDGYHEWLGNMPKGFEEYETLLDDNCFSDVTFNIQDKKLYLHKAILSCRNSVFKAMFEHEMKENKESVVEIMDVDYDVMKELIRFIYSGRVENIEKIAKDLLVVADKYSVTILKALCEKTLYDNLRNDNAIESLKLADMCDTLRLKKLVIEFIVNNLKNIVKESNFKSVFSELNREIVCEIMEAVAEKD